MINPVGVLSMILLCAGLAIWTVGAALRSYAWAQVDELRVRALLDYSLAAMGLGSGVFFTGVGVVLAIQAGGV